MTLEKKCVICGKKFPKDKRVSMRIWENQTRFCSQQCVSKDKVILANRKKGIIQSFKKGRKIWNKGTEGLMPDPWNKGSNGEYARKLGFGLWMKGKKQSLETRQRKSEAAKRRVASGKHNFWKGGVTSNHRLIRTTLPYKLWREFVFRRDNWTCQECRARSGNGKRVYLNADHIQPFSTHKELRFDIDNGRTLCRECHYKRHSK